jgi:hypothetical protein
MPALGEDGGRRGGRMQVRKMRKKRGWLVYSCLYSTIQINLTALHKRWLVDTALTVRARPNTFGVHQNNNKMPQFTETLRCASADDRVNS